MQRELRLLQWLQIKTTRGFPRVVHFLGATGNERYQKAKGSTSSAQCHPAAANLADFTGQIQHCQHTCADQENKDAQYNLQPNNAQQGKQEIKHKGNACAYKGISHILV